MTGCVHRPALLAALPLCLAFTAPLFAAPRIAPESQTAVAAAIRLAARAAAPPDAAVTIGSLTGADTMPACTGALAVAISGAAPYELAAVQCPALGWTLYVAIQVAVSQLVVVAAHPLAPGHSLGPADLVLARIPVASFAGRQVFTDPAALIGASPLLGIAAGGLITAAQIDEPLLVRAGQSAIVQVVSGNVTLAITATADASGRLGDMVLFTNPASGRRFSALITASGPVVNLP